MFIASSTVPRLDGYDPVVSRFVRSGLALSAATIQTGKLDALNIMVKALKQFLLFDKFTAFYPILGGLASWHSFNLIDPTTFQITWNGTVTHSADGVKSDGVTGYGDTGFIRTGTILTQGCYANTFGDGYCIGTDDDNTLFDRILISGADIDGRVGDGSAQFSSTPNTGLIVASSKNNGDLNLFIRGSSVASATVTDATTLGNPEYVLNGNSASGFFTNRFFQLFFISEVEWTTTEHSNLNYIVNQYQTSLARGV